MEAIFLVFHCVGSRRRTITAQMKEMMGYCGYFGTPKPNMIDYFSSLGCG
jgi:hypothetical protein